MNVLDYRPGKASRSQRWKWRYLVGAPVIALLHAVGSIMCFRALVLNWGDPAPLLQEFVSTFEFPMVWAGGRAGWPQMYSDTESFVLYAVINAITWGVCLIGIWRASANLYARLWARSELKGPRPFI